VRSNLGVIWEEFRRKYREEKRGRNKGEIKERLRMN